MKHNIRTNSKEFRYKYSDQLFAGLFIMESDEDSYEILETFEKYIDSVLEKCVNVTSRSEAEVYNEIVDSCASSIEGLKRDYITDILEAFTTFFLYDFSTKEFIISRNITCDDINERIVISSKDGKTPLVDFISEKPDEDNVTSDTRHNDGESEVVLLGNNEDETITIDYKGKWKKLTKITVAVICGVIVLYGGVKLYNTLTHQSTNTIDSGGEDGETDNIINLEVVNELATDGRLYAKEDGRLIIKYFVTRDMGINENTINWSKCPLLNSNDTLFPKRNCKVFIHATLRGSNEDTYSQEIAYFDFHSYIEQLVMTNTNPQRRKSLLSYSYSRPLTICYDNATEDVCEKMTDKGFIDNLRMSLKEGEYHIDSVAFYSNADIMEDILSNQYPQLKYIGCSSN